MVGEEREALGPAREVGSPGDVPALNIWSLNHTRDDSQSPTVINRADLKIDPESNNH